MCEDDASEVCRLDSPFRERIDCGLDDLEARHRAHQPRDGLEMVVDRARNTGVDEQTPSRVLDQKRRERADERSRQRAAAHAEAVLALHVRAAQNRKRDAVDDGSGRERVERCLWNRKRTVDEGPSERGDEPQDHAEHESPSHVRSIS